MTLSQDETKELINLVLTAEPDAARDALHVVLKGKGQNEGQFYESIVKHGPNLLTTDQWFELLSRLPNRVLRSQIHIANILSEEQIKKLPPVSG